MKLWSFNSLKFFHNILTTKGLPVEVALFHFYSFCMPKP